MTSEFASPSPVSKAFIPGQTTEDAARQRAGIAEQPLPGVNYLEMIFEGQKHLMTKFHDREKNNGSPVINSDEEGLIDDRRVAMRMHELYGYLVRELSEAMQEVKSKPWKMNPGPSDKQALWNELGDAFHFFVELCITAGMDADDLHRAYFRMHQKNNTRLAGTY